MEKKQERSHTDKMRMASWRRVKNLETAVRIFLDNSEFVGTDPYYRDLNGALWDMLERAAKHEGAIS